MMKKLLTSLAMAAMLGTSVVTSMSVSTALAGDIPFLTAQEAGDWSSRRLVGTKVLNGVGEKIGDINDVIIDINGRATTVIIGVGGYLGFNEKSVGVPYDLVQIGDVLGGSRIVVLNATKAELTAAPAYKISDPTKTERLKRLAKDWGAKAKIRAIELSKKAAVKAKELKDKAAEAMKKKAPAQ